eukprot:gene25872-biopygen9062
MPGLSIHGGTSPRPRGPSPREKRKRTRTGRGPPAGRGRFSHSGRTHSDAVPGVRPAAVGAATQQCSTASSGKECGPAFFKTPGN